MRDMDVIRWKRISLKWLLRTSWEDGSEFSSVGTDSYSGLLQQQLVKLSEGFSNLLTAYGSLDFNIRNSPSVPTIRKLVWAKFHCYMSTNLCSDKHSLLCEVYTFWNCIILR